MEKPLTGIVLAGGKSQRMGKDKGMCILQGKPLVNYALETLKQKCDQILIGANTTAYASFGFSVIKDEFTGIGPIAGLYSCLNASKTSDNFVLSCDMPWVSGELIQYVLAKRKHHQVVIPVVKGLPEPLCAYYRKDIVPILAKKIQQGVYKLQDAIKDTKILFLDIPEGSQFDSETLFYNINSAADLKKAEKYINHRDATHRPS